MVATDSGSGVAPNVNQSAAQSFTITVNAVNDEPSFTIGPNQSVPQNAGPQTVNGWATDISAGPPDEVQTVDFTVTVSGTTGTLTFDSAPAVSSDGDADLSRHQRHLGCGYGGYLPDRQWQQRGAERQRFTDPAVHHHHRGERRCLGERCDRWPSHRRARTNMLFTVAMQCAGAAGGASVNYATANGGGNPATGGAACGGAVDYVNTNGTVNFAAGEQVKTVSIAVCSDTDSAETNETFLVNLSERNERDHRRWAGDGHDHDDEHRRHSSD